MNLYAISSYKEVIIYIDIFLGTQMFDEGHPVEIENEKDSPNDVYFFMVGRLVFQETSTPDYIHIMPHYKNSYSDYKNVKMKIYTFNKKDIISIQGWLK